MNEWNSRITIDQMVQMDQGTRMVHVCCVRVVSFVRRNRSRGSQLVECCRSHAERIPRSEEEDWYFYFRFDQRCSVLIDGRECRLGLVMVYMA